ncbi:MAG: inorganic phosphate transporter [Actinomycetes bacterium]
MTVEGVAALVVAVGFAFMLGVSDAPNASAALIAARATSYRGAVGFALVAHVAGGLLAGQAVARTMVGLVHVTPAQVAATYLAGGIASIGFTLVATRRGIPVSASIGLVGGLVGAAVVLGGWQAVGWGGLHGGRPYGVIGTLAAIVVSPVLGAGVAALARRGLAPLARRATRRSLHPLRGLIWLAAGLVGLADGSNDGQKAMGLVTGLLLAAGVIPVFAVPFWVTALVAVVLAVGTAAGGQRIIRTVSSRFYRGGPLDGLAAQAASALTILGAGYLGAPVSTSTVVASGMVGVGAARRRRHVRWATVSSVVTAWIVTVPACALVGAGLAGADRLLGGGR